MDGVVEVITGRERRRWWTRGTGGGIGRSVATAQNEAAGPCCPDDARARDLPRLPPPGRDHQPRHLALPRLHPGPARRGADPGRGIIVTREGVRQWSLGFGAGFALRLRRRRPGPGDTRHLDEVFPRITACRIASGARRIRTAWRSTSRCRIGAIPAQPGASPGACRPGSAPAARHRRVRAKALRTWQQGTCVHMTGWTRHALGRVATRVRTSSKLPTPGPHRARIA